MNSEKFTKLKLILYKIHLFSKWNGNKYNRNKILKI